MTIQLQDLQASLAFNRVPGFSPIPSIHLLRFLEGLSPLCFQTNPTPTTKLGHDIDRSKQHTALHGKVETFDRQTCSCACEPGYVSQSKNPKQTLPKYIIYI